MSFSPIIRVRKFLDKMKAERDSPRGIKRFPSRAASGDLDRQKNYRTSSDFCLENGSNYDSMDMTPLVEQFRTFSEHFSLKLGESAFSVLPNEAILIIFSFLEVDNLFQARRVCKDWCGFADDNLIWRSLVLSDFGLHDMYGSTWKETYYYLNELFSDGLWEGMSKWVQPEGFDNEQKTTAKLQFLKRTISSDKNPVSKPSTSSPAVLHRVDSSANASPASPASSSTEPKYANFEQSMFKIAGQGVTINCSSPSPFKIEGERELSDPKLETFVWNKHFDKHTSVYKGKIDYGTRTVSGTIEYYDGVTQWKGVFYYTKAKKNPNVKYNLKQINA